MSVLLTVGLLGCGRPATEQDCEKIVERIAELELKAQRVEDPDAIQGTVEATKQAFRKQTMQQCVGKRITQRALDCVNQATTAKQIVEDCFN